MTSFAFAFGVLPLMVAAGAGGELRRAIGTAAFWGMLGVTLFGIFLTPVFYVVLRRMAGEKTKAGNHSSPGGAIPSTTAVLLMAGSVSGLLLGGCAAGPNYRPPETKVRAAFANAGQTNLSTTAVETNWWRSFNDATLDRLIQAAVAGNHDLRIAAARLREARALRSAAVWDLFPTAQAGAGYTKGVNSKDAMHGAPRPQRETDLYDAGFDATWELDLFGRVRRSVQASTADMAAIEASRREMLVSLIAEVARNHCELRGLQHQLAVARRNADIQRETLEIILAKLSAGRGTELDAARARAQLNATLAILPPLEGAIQRAIYRLGVLTGSEPGALEAELAQVAPLPGVPALVNIGNPEELLRRRPDIRAAERALAAATARIGVATADLFPRVTFNGRVALQAGEISGLGGSGSDTYAFGPRISWAALDLGHVRARLEAARARADARLAAYEKTVLLALEETEGALVEFGRAQARRDYLRSSAQSAREASRLANERHTGGVTEFLTVLDAQRTQLTIEDQLAQAETRAATALVAIYKALGGGWPILDQQEHASK
jgi:multidrug efflux system outer membrane protein